MLSREQIEFYHEHGYLLVENVLSDVELKTLQTITYDLIEKSKDITESNDAYDLDEGHSRHTPRLTRIKLPHKQDPYFWEVLTQSNVTRVLNDLLGEDTTLITAKLNTKAPGGGQAVEWHQDWAFYPHTNDDLLAFGIMLEDVTPDNGPLMVIPGTHKGPLLSHKHEGLFCGAIHPDDPLFEQEKAVTLTGKAGSMTVHHVRTLHGSAPNMSDKNRLILFYELASGDAWPILGAGSYLHELGQRKFWEDLQTRLVTGSIITEPRLEKVPASMPLAPAADNTSIFKTQKSGGAKSAFS
ncbi:MAG: phytanoyl-CoA dioxygenase family protein [Candidatus Puniceispirillaceae bacterium]|jgi:ectoine hydroxylase-related dioxygenase (phytanoyl-CoA dioxygenase family)